MSCSMWKVFHIGGPKVLALNQSEYQFVSRLAPPSGMTMTIGWSVVNCSSGCWPLVLSV